VAPDSRSVLARPGADPDAVVRYGDSPDHLVDVHLPSGAARPCPLLVLWHGGFWRQEYDRRHTRPMAGALREAGFAVATPEYRRTGRDGGWPATFDDVAAVRKRLPGLLRDVAPGRVAAGPVTLVGHSAGGQLAIWWALTAEDRESVRGVVALAPVANLSRAHAERLDGGAVAALMGGSPRRHPDRYDIADTARLLGRPNRPPITVLHGSADAQVPVTHSRALPGVSYFELPGIDHFALIDPLSAAWPRVLDALRSAPPVSAG